MDTILILKLNQVTNVQYYLKELLHFQVLDCAPNGNDCGKKLLDSIEEYLDKNIVVILLNTDHSMVNCQKNALVYSLREKEEKIIISEHGLDQDSIGLQLVADANSLKKFLQVLLKITLFAFLYFITIVFNQSFSISIF